MRRLLIAPLSLSFLMLSACGSHNGGAIVPEGSSRLTNISLNLPDKTKFPEAGRAKLTGARVVIEPLTAGCAEVIDAVQGWTQTVIEKKLKQGCDYSLGVELGALDQTQVHVSPVYFTNWKGPKQGLALRKEAFAGQAQIAVQIPLTITQAGIDAGLGPTPPTTPPTTPPVTPPESTDLVISVTIGGSPDGTRPPEVSPTTGDVYDWRKAIQWSSVASVPWSGEDYGSAYLQDVMTHTDDRYLTSTPTTNSHETMHGLLNAKNNETAARDQFIYYEQGQGAYVIEPALHASKIKDYVPAGARSLASSRYQLYLVDQVERYFPNVLYQFDEWNSYVTNSRVGVELDRNGRLGEAVGNEVCVIDGAVDFLYFASAAVAALEESEPTYLASNAQFKAAYAMLAEQTVDFVKYSQGKDKLTCTGERLLGHFVTSAENTVIRAALKGWMGAAWTQRVFGF